MAHQRTPRLPPRLRRPHAPPVNPTPSVSIPEILQTFAGTGAMTTPLFTVPDDWEVRWSCLRVISIGIYSADGTLVTGAAGVLRGSLYLSQGGSYFLQIDGEKTAATPTPPDAANPSAWHVIVVQVTPSPSPSPLTVFQPNYNPISGSLQPGAPAAGPNPPSPPPPVDFTDDQAGAIVRVAGDNAQGAGFLVRTPDGPFVVTALHVLANNPNLKIVAGTGTVIPILSAKAAADRDIALLAIADSGPDAPGSYLPMSTDITQSVHPGDEVLTTLFNPEDQGRSTLRGQVTEIGPDRVDYTVKPARGTSGSPVLDCQSGQVLGLATKATPVPTVDNLEATPFALRQDATRRSPHFYCLRVDAVSNWLPIDLDRFQSETGFIARFHAASQSLDSYLNPTPDGRLPDDEMAAMQALPQRSGHHQGDPSLRPDKYRLRH